MKKRITKLLALLLAFTMVVCMDSSIIFALEKDSDIIISSTDDSDILITDSTVQQDAGQGTVQSVNGTDDESIIADDSSQTNVLRGDNDIIISDPAPVSNSNESKRSGRKSVDADKLFHRNLTVDEQEAKDKASADEEEVKKAKEGEDYLADEVIALCDTEAEAEEIAKAYADSTGYTVKVDSFSYGVAVLKMYGQPDRDKLNEYVGTASLNSVESFVKLGADTSNNLPAVYPNYIRYAYSVDTSNEHFTDPYLKSGSQYYQYYHELINDKFVWTKYENDATYKNNLKNIHVAVIDTGINYEHSDFSGVLGDHTNYVDYELDRDGYSYDSTPYEQSGGDTNAHGSNVAGIIGNIANGIGGRGVASGVTIDSYRALGRWGRGKDSWILSGLSAAVRKQGTKVINMSLGGTSFNSAYEPILTQARTKGILVIAAAGNENTSVNAYPAAYEGIMSVAALNSDYEKSDFSNYGNWVDIAAPGGELKPDGNSPNYERKEYLYASGMKNDTTTNTVVGMMGTSQATPVVSGCAALLFAQDTSRRPEYVEHLLKSTAKPLNSKYAIGVGCVNIAEAMEVDITVPAPSSDTPSGQIEEGTYVELSLPDFDYADDSVIKYTLNGKAPFDSNTSSGDVFTYDGSEPIFLSDESGSGKACICAQALVYGITSAPVTYNYTFDATLAGISIKTPNGKRYADVAEGKSIKLQAVNEPVYAENKTVTWTVADPQIATVDKNGIVKGINRGETQVTATAAGATDTINVYVKAPAEQIVINKNISLTLDDNTNNKYVIQNEDIKIYPLMTASGDYKLESSNTKVAVVEYDNGKYTVKAVSQGDAVITATTVDGTNLKDTENVHVGIKVSSIHISDKDGLNILTTKKNLTPDVIYNGNKQGTSSDADLEWIINSGSEYAKFENGILKANDNVSSQKTVTIQAKSGEIKSNKLSVKLYPITTKITALSQYFSVNYSYPLSYLFEINPSSAYGKLKYECNNKAVIIDNETETVFFSKAGNYSITAETLDGSKIKKSITAKINDPNEYIEGLKCKKDHPVIYPGKTIGMELVKKGNPYIPPDFDCKLGIYDNGYYKTKNNLISISGFNVTGLKTDALKSVDPGSVHYVYWGETYKFSKSTIYFYPRYSAHVELYPAGTSRVLPKFRGEDAFDEKWNPKTYNLNINDKGQITASSSPYNACQKYYTYKSSNTKVVTVDSSGWVKAVGNGKATVTVTAGDGSGKTAKVNFVVAKLAESITIGSKTSTFKVIPGKSLSLTATVLPANTADKKVTWEIVSGAEHATINASGTLSAKSPGRVTVKATNNASGRSDQKVIEIWPATKSITVNDEYKNGLKLYTTEVGDCHDQVLFKFKVESAIPGTSASEPTVTSSNTNIVTVEKESHSLDNPTITYTYIVTATGKAGSTTININATDGSGKKASIKVNVLVPVTDISISATGGVNTVTPGKTITLNAVVNKDASNKKVKWSIIPYEGKDVDETEELVKNYLGIDVDAFKKTGKITMKKGMNNADGYFDVKAEATDGSEKYATFTVYGKADKVAAIKINGEDGKEVKTAKLGTYQIPNDKTRTDDFATYRDFPISVYGDGYWYQDVPFVTSSNESIVRAEILRVDNISNSRKLRIYTYDSTQPYRSTKTGTATVTVKAADGSGKSATLKVTVSEPVRNIYLSADKSTRDIAANGKITMKATVPNDATNKKVNWSLKNADGKATISSSGVITPDKNLAVKTTIKAVATAADGYGTKAEETITLYPAQGNLAFYEGASKLPSSIQLTPGTTKVINVKGDKADAFADYLVTYGTGPIKIQYVKKNENGATTFKITAIKKGSSTVKAEARDGSGKSVKMKVTVK